MARWEGFAEMRRPGDVRQLRVVADSAGPDDLPIPLAIIMQNARDKQDLVQLTAEDLRWLVDEVPPIVLKRMGERP